MGKSTPPRRRRESSTTPKEEDEQRSATPKKDGRSQCHPIRIRSRSTIRKGEEKSSTTPKGSFTFDNLRVTWHDINRIKNLMLWKYIRFFQKITHQISSQDIRMTLTYMKFKGITFNLWNSDWSFAINLMIFLSTLNQNGIRSKKHKWEPHSVE